MKNNKSYESFIDYLIDKAIIPALQNEDFKKIEENKQNDTSSEIITIDPSSFKMSEHAEKVLYDSLKKITS